MLCITAVGMAANVDHQQHMSSKGNAKLICFVSWNIADAYV